MKIKIEPTLAEVEFKVTMIAACLEMNPQSESDWMSIRDAAWDVKDYANKRLRQVREKIK